MRRFSRNFAKIFIAKNNAKILYKKIMWKFREKNPSPIDELTQNINIDLGTTRRHKTVREIFANFAKFSLYLFSRKNAKVCEIKFAIVKF